MTVIRGFIVQKFHARPVDIQSPLACPVFRRQLGVERPDSRWNLLNLSMVAAAEIRSDLPFQGEL